jgi:hypothetical protein
MSNEQRWWVAVNGQPQGPWTIAEVSLRISQNLINTKTLVCPLNGQAWVPITQVSELSKLLPVSQPIPQAFAVPEQPALPTIPAINPFAQANPYASPSGNYQDSAKVTAPWSGIANLVMIYCQYVAPIYIGLNVLNLFINGVTIHPDSPIYFTIVIASIFGALVQLAQAVLFLIAGTKWQQKQKASIFYTATSITIGLVGILVALLVLICLIPAMAKIPDNAPEISETTFSLLLQFVGLVLLCWEIFVLIWLYLHARALPWPNQSQENRR